MTPSGMNTSHSMGMNDVNMSDMKMGGMDAEGECKISVRIPSPTVSIQTSR